MKKKASISLSQSIAPDAPPETLRAHAIADTLRSVARHCEINWQNDARAAVAQELGVPEMWLEAALGDIRNEPTVSLDLLEEYRDWRVRVLDAGKAVS
jgi:hypothetical protein